MKQLLKDLLNPIKFIRSLPRLISKIALIPPEVTYYYVLNENENKWTMNLRELDEINSWLIDNRKLWERYKRILNVGQSLGFIDVFHSNTDRGNRIPCIFIRPPNTRRIPEYAIVYSHNNGSDLGINLSLLWKLSKKTKCFIFSYDYSGYGISTGKPSEMNIYFDIASAVNTLISRYNIGPKKIILCGESMGSVPTIDLSSRVNFAGVVLQAAFMSGIRVLYLYKRKTWIFDPFPNIEKVHRIQCPVLVIHGTKDSLVDITQGFAIYKKCKYKVEPLWIKNGYHNDIRFSKLYYPRIRRFFKHDLKSFSITSIYS